MQDTSVRPVSGFAPGSAPFTPPGKADLARIDLDKAETAKVETGLGAWASAISADDNAQAAIALAEAINRARNSQASRENRAADARVIAVSRLETLRARLAPVYAAIPRDVELFDLGMVGHTPPRLFVDIIAFVEMAEDKRSFRLVQETRSGRVVLGEAADERQMTALVTNYIAERLVERERALAAQGVHARPMALPKVAVGPDPQVVKLLPSQADVSSVSSSVPVAVSAPEGPGGNVQAAIRDMASAATAAMAAPASATVSGVVPGAVVATAQQTAEAASSAASSASQTEAQGLRVAPVAAATAVAAAGAAGAATMRQAERARTGGGGWFWPMLALLIGIGLGALALYLYAASLSRP